MDHLHIFADSVQTIFRTKIHSDFRVSGKGSSEGAVQLVICLHLWLIWLVPFTYNAGILFSDLGENRTCAENICEQNCTQLINGGFVCSCSPGFKPSTLDKNSCQGRIFSLPLFPIYCLVVNPLYNFLEEVSSLGYSQCQLMKVLLMMAAHYTSKTTRNHKASSQVTTHIFITPTQESHN